MSILTAMRDMGRLRQITQVLIKHGFGELVYRLGLTSSPAAEEKEGVPIPPLFHLGTRLRLVLQELGPTFVKLGQMVSTRPDVIPEDIVLELKKLQDDVPPFTEEDVRKQIEESLGAPVEQLFTDFDSTPLASASMAQVHRATLQIEGEELVAVVLKVQRPGIDVMVEGDLHLLHHLARLIEKTIPESRVYSPTGLVREFDKAICAELDFRIEAMNAARFDEYFAGDEDIHFPKIFNEVSGRRVLTMEYLDGLKIDQAASQGANSEWIAKTAVRIILKMVFEDGFFHADPHPGNVLILPSPKDGIYPPEQRLVIGLLDLGLVGRLSPELRDKSVDLLLAAARRDSEAMADAMLAIGHCREKVDLGAFREHIREVSERHLGRSLKDMETSAIIRDIVTGAMIFGIQIPVELTMMLRAIMTIEGVGKEIQPDLDVLEVAKPMLVKIVWQRYHPLKIGNELLRGVGRFGGLARDLPFHLHEIIEDTRQGRLRIVAQDPARTCALERLGKQIRAAIVSSSLLWAGVALMISDHPHFGLGLLIGSGIWMIFHLFFDHQKKNNLNN